MMEISRQNYELFFVDYHDGNLSEKQIERLLQFIQSNPDLEEEFYAYQSSGLSKLSTTTFPHKSSLVKSINDLKQITRENFDEYCVAYIENDLNENNRAKFEMFLSQNEALSKEFELYKRTKLPAEIVPYEHKDKLKKYTGKVLYLRNAIKVAAAASVVGIGILLFRINTQEQIQITEVNPILENKELFAEITKEVEVKTTEKKEGSDKTGVKPNQSDPKKPAKSENKEEKTEKKPQKPSEKLMPARRKGIYLVNNDWRYELNIQAPTEHVASNIDANYQDELEALIAEAPNYDSEELSIEKVKDLLNSNKKIQDITVWELADLGLRGFGRLTESSYSVKPILNESGKIASVAFSTDKYTLFAPLRRSDR